MKFGKELYYCAHCGLLDAPESKHLDDCKILQDTRLNGAVVALAFAREMLIANDVYGHYTAEVIDGELRKHGAATGGAWPLK